MGFINGFALLESPGASCCHKGELCSKSYNDVEFSLIKNAKGPLQNRAIPYCKS